MFVGGLGETRRKLQFAQVVHHVYMILYMDMWDAVLHLELVLQESTLVV